VRLLKVDDVSVNFPSDAKNLEIRHSVDLPPDDTTYWCSVHKLPEVFQGIKHHAIQVIHQQFIYPRCQFLSFLPALVYHQQVR
jgi:hypothetical protein